MKKFLTISFATLGVIFFVILLALAYLWVADPFNIKPFIFNSNEQRSMKTTDKNNSTIEGTSGESAADTTTKTESSNLSPAQAGALEAVGIDPATMPQSFTPEQLTCFEAILGAQRVGEIKAGATPTIPEFYSAKGCI